MNQPPRIAIIHDAFLYRGGGERLVTLMAKSLDADLISGFFSEGSFDPRELGFGGKMISLGKPVFMKGVRHMILKWRFFWKASILSDYDIVIFSGDCLGALRHVRTNAKKVYYCHTPPRYLYDFRQRYISALSWMLRPFFQKAFDYFARIYESHLESFDLIFTNSQNTHDRLLHFCKKESTILYPPTDTSRFVPSTNFQGTENSHGSYFLSFARLSPPKRVDMIVDAFLQVPDKQLIFTYGKNDPQKEDILSKIQQAHNIVAIEAPEESELIELIQGAIATIYIPVDEDFGMSPVESMACGVPVIGAREGGLLETIGEGKTGKLIEIENHESGIINLQKVIQETPLDEWKNMKIASREQAEDFSLEMFTENLKKYLQRT